MFGDRLDEQERGYVSGGKSALRGKLKAYSLISRKPQRRKGPPPPKSEILGRARVLIREYHGTVVSLKIQNSRTTAKKVVEWYQGNGL